MLGTLLSSNTHFLFHLPTSLAIKTAQAPEPRRLVCEPAVWPQASRVPLDRSLTLT